MSCLWEVFEKCFIKFFGCRFFLKRSFYKKDLKSANRLIKKYNMYKDINKFVRECAFEDWNDDRIDNFIAKKFVSRSKSKKFFKFRK